MNFLAVPLHIYHIQNMIAKTLHYLGADCDISFLAYLPLYQSYRLYDFQQDDEFKNKIAVVYEGLFKNDKIDFKYKIGHDCSKPMNLDGDVYVCGYYPSWFDTYTFSGHVYMSRNTVQGVFDVEMVGKKNDFLDHKMEIKIKDGKYVKHAFDSINIIDDESQAYLAMVVKFILKEGREAFEDDAPEYDSDDDYNSEEDEEEDDDEEEDEEEDDEEEDDEEEDDEEEDDEEEDDKRECNTTSDKDSEKVGND